MKRTYKFIFFILIFLLIFLSFNKNSYAVEYFGKPFPEFPVDFYNSEYVKMIVYLPNQDKYQLYIFDTNRGPFFNTSVNNIPSDKKTFADTYDWVKGSNEWTFIYRDTGVFNISRWSGYCEDDDINKKELIYSSVDIPYGSRDSDTYFFYKTPLVNFSNMQMSFGGTTWQMIIQITISILVVVVSLVGLRKALQMLLTLLRQS